MTALDTPLVELLDAHPELVDVLAELHAGFARFRDPRARRRAARITVAEAARMAGLEPPTLLHVLRRALGEAHGAEALAAAREVAPAPRPERLERLRPVELDVRGDIRAGREPFARIMGAVRQLGPGEALVLRAPFEPLPLYDVLGRRGLAHWTERLASDDWRVWFYRPDGSTAVREAEAAAEVPAAPAAREELVVDVRGLEPPQPLIRVLECLQTLGPDQTLRVVHERRPLLLYPHLEARGFTHETREPEPGRVEIVIRRAAGAVGSTS